MRLMHKYKLKKGREQNENIMLNLQNDIQLLCGYLTNWGYIYTVISYNVTVFLNAIYKFYIHVTDMVTYILSSVSMYSCYVQ